MQAYLEPIIIGILIILLILFISVWLWVWQPKQKLLFVATCCAVGGTLMIGVHYFIIHQTDLYGTWLYEVLQIWRTESYAWSIGIIVSIMGLLITIAVEKIINYYRPPMTVTIGQSRRALFKKIGIAVPAVTIGGSSVVAFDGQYRIEVTHHELAFPRLPQYLHNYRLAQISDVHIGPCIDLQEFDRIMDYVLAEKPQRLLITGDLIDTLEWLPNLCERINKLVPQFPDGIDYILGNHEHFRDVTRVTKALRNTSMRVLVNENYQLNKNAGIDDRPVYLAGVDYNMNRNRIACRQEMMEQALAGIPDDAFVLLMAHHPEFFTEAMTRNIPMTFSGHTHGGQINILGLNVVPIGTPYVKGMYVHGTSCCYVNRGSGHWWPIRINCPREISIFTFRSQ